MFAILCIAFDQISDHLTGATVSKLDERLAKYLMNMFERSVALTQQVKQLSGDNLRNDSVLILIGKLNDCANEAVALLRKAIDSPIEIQQVEDLMEKLDKVLQMVAESDEENGKEFRLNEKKL